jgi:spore germination protein
MVKWNNLLYRPNILAPIDKAKRACKSMRRKKMLLVWGIFVSLVMISGCAPFVENNTIEDIAPVTFWSISKGEKGKIKMSTLVPPLVNEPKSLLTLEVDLLKQGGKDFNLRYYRELKVGQLRMFLIHEELAKEGIIQLINTLLTDYDISQRMYLVIVKGNFDEYINRQAKKQENLDYYLYRMLRHYERKKQGEMTIVNLHEYKNKLFSPFSDPVLPVFKVSKDNFTYEGTAFFSNDKLIETVTSTEDQIFQLLDNDHYLKFFSIPELDVVIGHLRSRVNVDLDKNLSQVTINVKLNGRIEEYQGNKNILNGNELMQLQQEIETELEVKTTDLIKKMQEMKVDPLQIGTHTLSPFSKPISEKVWLAAWEKMNIKVNYQLYFEALQNTKNNY